MHRIALSLSLLLLAGSAGPVLADQLLLDAIRSPDGQQQGQAPRRGTTMEAVRSRFGTPEQTRPAVGDPPISRWQYPQFTVYFEHDRVIHAVARR